MKTINKNPDQNRILPYVILISFSFLFLISSGCSKLIAGKTTSPPPQSSGETENLVDEISPEVHGDLPPEIILKGESTLNALKIYNYELIEGLIHPDFCLRFSPYPYLADSNKVFCPGELLAISNTDILLEWGNYDGTGDPIQLTFNEYHDSFIYDTDYGAAPIIGFNVEVSSGNSINNISDLYPDGKMIEYYFPGFEAKYGGMDWRSLRLVFINVDGNWFLAAIIHGEWTI